MAKLLVLTGSDGVGKSTLCSHLLQELQSQLGTKKVSYFSLWDYIKQGELISVFEDGISFATSLSSRSRMSLLLFCFSRGLELLQSMQPEAEFILIDGYWFKYAANEIARGASPFEIESCFSLLPQPDLVFYLKADPISIQKRKKKFSSYEVGPNLQNRPMNMQFQWFQNKINQELTRMYRADDRWIYVDADRDILTIQSQLRDSLTHWMQTEGCFR